jgi:sugar O-acyltransferase (sialic acid O-acetyltransferase NeuD family)
VIRIVVLGAGGHGREVAEILRAQFRNDPAHEVAGFVDDDAQLWGKRRDGLPVLGDWSWFDGEDCTDIRVITAVGSPSSCRVLVARARARDLRFISACSACSLVSPLAQVGQGVTIFPHVVISTNVRIGDFSVLNVAATLSHDCDVGAYSILSPAVHLAGAVKLGDGCFVGMGANIIQSCTIGADSVIGAGAVVLGNLEPGVTAVGVPARVIRGRNEP